jgi:hypothetical protein
MSVSSQQMKMKISIESFAFTISTAARLHDAKWPTFTIPLFESIAYNVIAQSNAVSLVVSNFVVEKEADEWIEYANSHHRNVTLENHLLRYGHSENLYEDGYHPYFTQMNDSKYIPDVERPFYFPSTCF